MQIRTQDGQLMYEAEFRTHIKANGGPSWDTTTPEVLEALGADVVFEGPQASGGTVYQYSQRNGVEQIGDKWYTKYSVADMEAEAIAAKDATQAAAVRATRDAKLTALDWTQGKDIADEVSGPAATLRQALRDVPSQAGFPWEITWPDAA